VSPELPQMTIEGKGMEARYLNIDLIIESDSDITALSSYFEGKVFFLWNKTNSIGLETNLIDTTQPEEDMLELLNFIEALPSDLKIMWDNCKKKVMDIGYECGTMEVPIDSFIKSETIKRLAKLNCAINIRIYPSVEMSQNMKKIIKKFEKRDKREIREKKEKKGMRKEK
jgi:hypothetical protein